MNDITSDIDDFRIDSSGYILIAKLTEFRVLDDIKRTEEKLARTNSYYSKMSTENNFFNNMRRNVISNEISELNSELNKKRLWLSLWTKKCLEPIKSNSDIELYNRDIKYILSKFKENEENQFKLYLILEEVMLSPIYGEFEEFPKGLEERDIIKSCETISSYLGFSSDEGTKVLTNLTSYIKGLNDNRSKTIKWTLVGTLAIGAAAVIFAPAIAGAIGGLMGLHGAAATAAGLAFFGGGSLAAGGLGMAGGLSVIVGAGSILGAVGGYNAAKIVGGMPQEYISLSMYKLLRYIIYLDSLTGLRRKDAVEIKNRIIDRFSRLKYIIEYELLMGSYTDNIDNYIGNIRIMNYTYDKLIEAIIKK